MVSMKGRGFEKRNAAGKNVPRLITFFHLHCILGKFTIAEKKTDRLANLKAHNGCFWRFLSKNYLRQISILGTNK